VTSIYINTSVEMQHFGHTVLLLLSDKCIFGDSSRAAYRALFDGFFQLSGILGTLLNRACMSSGTQLFHSSLCQAGPVTSSHHGDQGYFLPWAPQGLSWEVPACILSWHAHPLGFWCLCPALPGPTSFLLEGMKARTRVGHRGARLAQGTISGLP
jgi:hypothetical protein